RHTRSKRDWSSDVCSSDLHLPGLVFSIRGKTECHTGKIAFFLCLHIFCQFCALTDTDREHAGHFRVQGAGMAYFFHTQYLSHLNEHVMTCHATRFIDLDYTMKHPATSICKDKSPGDDPTGLLIFDLIQQRFDLIAVFDGIIIFESKFRRLPYPNLPGNLRTDEPF